MKKLSLRLLTLLSISGVAAVQARTIETPLPSLYGYLRFPIEYEHEDDDRCWCFDWKVAGLGYARHADKAFGPCDSTCAVPYPNLVFGASSFRLSDIFVNSEIPAETVNNSNPFIAISTLNPNFEYNEKGAIFKLETVTHFNVCGCEYRLGLRAQLPVRDIQVGDICGLGDLVGETLDDVYQERNEVFGDGTLGNETKTNYVYAARLDFLTQLNRVAIPVESLVVYGDGTCSNRTTMADQDVGYPCATDPGFPNVDVTEGDPSIAIIRSVNGAVPESVRWGDRISDIYPIVAADGSGLSNLERGRLSDNESYISSLATNVAAQRQLFVVPTLQGTNGDETNDISDGAIAIQSAINAAIRNLNATVTDFITAQGLNFCDGRTKGLGDLYVDLWVGRNWECCNNFFWTDLKFTVLFPTADKLCNCKDLIKQPLGNDGHFEVMGGLAAGWDMCSRAKLMADITVSKVLSKTEQVAAPFQGATIKNIGPCICADVDWWYLVGHADLTFFACDNCGFDLGYEGYHKGCDKISLCQTTATDLLGNVDQPLDANVLSRGTERTAHKVRVGFFSIFDACEILGGWDYTFAGKNASRDVDWYLQFTVNF